MECGFSAAQRQCEDVARIDPTPQQCVSDTQSQREPAQPQREAAES